MGSDSVSPTGSDPIRLAALRFPIVPRLGPDPIRWLGVVVILMLTTAALNAVTVAGPEPATNRVFISDDLAVPVSPTDQHPVSEASDRSVKGFYPRAVSIRSLGVEARIIAMGTNEKGEMELPDDPKVLSWWRGSARAGATKGNTVVAGHVYQRNRGYGALWELAAVERGDPITLRGPKDQKITYTVTSVESRRKVDLSPAKIFDAKRSHQLVLITCGGYNRATDHYEDNVIVFAKPA